MHDSGKHLCELMSVSRKGREEGNVSVYFSFKKSFLLFMKVTWHQALCKKVCWFLILMCIPTFLYSSWLHLNSLLIRKARNYHYNKRKSSLLTVEAVVTSLILHIGLVVSLY